MAISNFICEECEKGSVCKYKDNILKYSDEAKKPLGIDITIDSCVSYTKDKNSK